MLFSAHFLILLAACVSARQGFRLGGYTPQASRAPSPNDVSPHVISLARQRGSLSAPYTKSIVSRNQVNGIYGLAPITPVEMGQVFLAPVKLARQTFRAVIDTGSSDTWIAQKKFQCINVTTGVDQPQSSCLFGPLYTMSKTFKQIPNQNFNISYADGEFLTGILGTERVTLAGIEVRNQEIAIVDYAAWLGDGTSSGLIGLAFPSLTSAYAGNDPKVDSKASQIQYNPIFTNMYKQGNVPSMFSLAINRVNNTGLMAIGGIPPVVFQHPFVSIPFQVLTAHNVAGPSINKPVYQFYTITASYVYAGSNGTKRSNAKGPMPFARPKDPAITQTIVDSGTTLLYVPTADADAVSALFSPPATYDTVQGVYFVDCNAKVPKFGVKISGVVFQIDPTDLILPIPGGGCISGINDGGSSFGILGDVFLKNVLAVFDVGASEMRFAARENH